MVNPKHILLPFQVCLGFWQIVKQTPFGAIIQCIVGWLLLLFRLSPTYSRLVCLPGRVFKTVQCHVITEAEQPNRQREYKTQDIPVIESSYLGHQFRLERREGSKLFLNGEMTYYITDTIWYYLVRMAKVARETVFLKGYKPFLPQVATGGVMTLPEVLDCLIINNKAIGILDNYLLLPVNLTVSDQTMLKFVNGGGLALLLSTKASWVFAAVISFMSALMEFSPKLRDALYAGMSRLFRWAMLLLCEKLPYSMRRHLHSLGIWVEKLKFSNPLLSSVSKKEICAVIGGGAKVRSEGAVVVPWLDMVEEGEQKTFNCGPIPLVCRFDAKSRFKCKVSAPTVPVFDVSCDFNEFIKLCTFVSCMAKNGLGSLKSCSRRNSVRVRGFKESVICYSKSGFPPVYELKLQKVVVQY